ncbi:MAG: hypothetical protein LUM44_08765 [Pyrinomonadaceae bacterium]|nr:hypothetical protein [Pyrinomonadaceae bacterium]
MQEMCINTIFMQKELRQTTILKLITTKSVGRQDEIVEFLEKKGFSVTQSSVSRDLDELGVIKVNGLYSMPSKPKSAISFGLSGMQTAGDNLIVIKCEAGMASAVCVRIDNTPIKEIVGTIAGEDTIFIAINDKEAQQAVMQTIWEIFEK